ncbi:MAG: hypothetical protein AB8I08_30750 [Sandaracinaceae bacterium]
MHPIFNRGFLAETFACLFLIGAGFAAGWALAPKLLTGLAGLLGVGALVATSPTDRLFVSLKLAFPCALPGAVTWVALLIYRGRAHMRPPVRGLALLLLLPWAVGLVAEACRAARVGWALSSMPTYGVEAILAVTEFAPGTWASRSIVGAAVLLWIAVFRYSVRPPKEG